MKKNINSERNELRMWMKRIEYKKIIIDEENDEDVEDKCRWGNKYGSKR